MVSLGLLLLRLVIGGLMMIHGYPKLFGGQNKSEELPKEATETLGEGFTEQVEQGGIEQTAGMMEQVGVPNPQGAAWAIAAVEFAGGMMLILGWMTRPAAAAIAFSQMVAINKVHADEGLVGGYEYNTTLIGAAGTLVLTGPGKIALSR
jgi:uncharacterized membrane protein YphA (DoxX/SURF4 family)